MLLWADDVDITLDKGKHALQHVHVEHMVQVT